MTIKGIKCQFESIGVFIPEKRITTKEIVGKVQSSCIRRFELLTGIKARHICAPGEDSLTLAVHAAEDCLRHSRYLPEDLDMILCCSISKQKNGASFQCEPPLSLYIKDAMGAHNALNFDITNACAGMLTGVNIAENFIKQGTIRSCMVISGEHVSRIADHAAKSVKSLLSSELASLTLGDAGAAVIIERASHKSDGLIVSDFTTLAQYNHLCIGRQSRTSAGFFMKTDARKIHEVSISNSTTIIEKVLHDNTLTMDQIDYLIPHQTSKSSIRFGAKHYANYFNAKPGEIVINLEEYGNTASTTHFLALYRYLKEQRFKQGDRIMLLGLASGLVMGIVIFTMNEMVNQYGR
ncbi:3-oxoacyl-ACP synthase [bacterium]|nr:3-oxoacyl-ACP synthase [bacterium]